MLATVLFTEIVGSRELAARLGDLEWRDLLEHHHRAIRRELDRFGGREIDTAGDGFLAAFDGPASAIRCARSIIAAVRPLELRVRIGVHTGECEAVGEKVTRIVVHIGARLAAASRPGETVATRTVRDLVAGSGIEFKDRGAQH